MRKTKIRSRWRLKSRTRHQSHFQNWALFPRVQNDLARKRKPKKLQKALPLILRTRATQINSCVRVPPCLVATRSLRALSVRTARLHVPLQFAGRLSRRPWRHPRRQGAVAFYDYLRAVLLMHPAEQLQFRGFLSPERGHRK